MSSLSTCIWQAVGGFAPLHNHGGTKDVSMGLAWLLVALFEGVRRGLKLRRVRHLGGVPPASWRCSQSDQVRGRLRGMPRYGSSSSFLPMITNSSSSSHSRASSYFSLLNSGRFPCPGSRTSYPPSIGRRRSKQGIECPSSAQTSYQVSVVILLVPSVASNGKVRQSPLLLQRSAEATCSRLRQCDSQRGFQKLGRSAR